MLVLAVAIGAAGVVLAARGRAQLAADAAALAAAPVTFRPFGATGSPTDEARRFAVLNGATLVSCSCPLDESFESRTVTVVVEVPVGLGSLPVVRLRATGRAEFSPALLLLPVDPPLD